MRRLIWLLAAAVSLAVCLGIPASTARAQARESAPFTAGFNFSLSAASGKQETAGVRLKAGDTVTVKGTCSPFSAWVKYGFVAPDGLFYGVPGEAGSLDYTFTVGRSGTYFFAVLNNTPDPVSVRGYFQVETGTA